MSPSRFAVLVSVLVASGCYSDAPPQSTFPEPQYVAGPPGGTVDPGYGYGNGSPYADPRGAAVAAPAPGGPAVAGDADDADDADDEEANEDGSEDTAAAPAAPGPDDVAAGPGAPAPDEAQPGQPGELGAPGPDDVAAAPAPAPTGTVTDAEIDTTLDGYGQWIETDDYGPVWRPDATVVGVDFTPYESGGSWVYSDAGWAFSCDYPWGWLPFHYGRWAWFHDYWAWVPGHRWGPAWVDWRHGGGVVGWRPRPPRILDRRPPVGHFGRGVRVRDHRHAKQHDAHWRFATTSDFSRPHVRAHRYGNLAEGLRVTSKVAAPPVRAHATVRAADLMRSRFAAGRAVSPGAGRFGGSVQVRDHRGVGAGRVYPPAAAPGQAVRPPLYRPPTGMQPPPAAQPGRTWRPPPAAQPGRTWQPPPAAQPGRTWQPPPAAQPGRTWQPPPAAQPGRTWQPPPAAQPGRTWQPPARTYQPPPAAQPPTRTFQPHAPSSPPSHSSSPPARSWSPPSSPSHSSSSHSSSGSSHSSSSSSHSGSSGSRSSSSSSSSSRHR